MTQDFDPIVEEGVVVHPERRRFAWRQAKAALPNVPVGFARVLMDGSGRVLADDGGQRTAGEEYWESAEAWVKVDLGQRDLVFEFTHFDATLDAGYIIRVTVSAQVLDPSLVVKLKYRSIATLVRPVVTQHVRSALVANSTRPNQGRASDGPTDKPVLALQNGLSYLQEDLEKFLMIGATLQLSTSAAESVEAHVASSVVAFDDATRSHLDSLVAARRQTQITAALHANNSADVANAILIRKQWQGHLSETMIDPLLRAIEVVSADPSAANIREVVNGLNEADKEGRGEVLSFLKVAMDKNQVADVDELRAMKALIDEMSSRQGRAGGGGRHAPEISSTPAASIGAGDKSPDANWGTSGV